MIVFQKNCTSGTVINIGSNEWCTKWGLGRMGAHVVNPNGSTACGESKTVLSDRRLLGITRNIIYLMYFDRVNSTIGENNGDELFEAPRDSNKTFVLKPTYTGVDYNICSTGQVNVTPCGVYMEDGYRVDHGLVFEDDVIINNHQNNVFSISIDSACTDYHGGLRIAKDVSTDEIIGKLSGCFVDVFPNPILNGTATIHLSPNVKEMTQFELYDVYGNLLKTGYLNGSNTNLDLHNCANGAYYIKVNTSNPIVKKIILQNHD